MAVGDPLWLVIAQLVAVVLLVLLNAFFVAAEFAIVKVRITQVAARSRAGDARARIAQHVTGHLDAYLSACQLGITLASLGLGWIGEPAIADLLEPAFVSAGVRDEVLLHTTSFAVAFGLITFLHIVFGELAPKSIAIRHAEDATLALARPLHWFYRAFRPAIVLLNGVANRMLKLAGFEPATGTEQAHSEAELREILAASGQGPREDRSRFLLNLFDLRALKASDVMTPAPRVVALDVRKPLEENVRAAEDAGYSRYPIVDGNLDNVLGMVHQKDIASRILRKDRPEQSLLDIKRDVQLVPDSQNAEALLQQLIRRGQHLAVVVDEHGRTVGLVTMEDLFEEVFGNIRDEFDEPEQSYKALPDGSWMVDGTMSLHDLDSLCGTRLRRPGVSTLSGLVIEHAGRIPVAGETFRIDGLELTVREVGRRRVRSVEVRRVTAAAEQA